MQMICIDQGAPGRRGDDGPPGPSGQPVSHKEQLIYNNLSLDLRYP
jgi:hypothetical protein